MLNAVIACDSAWTSVTLLFWPVTVISSTSRSGSSALISAGSSPSAASCAQAPEERPMAPSQTTANKADKAPEPDPRAEP